MSAVPSAPFSFAFGGGLSSMASPTSRISFNLVPLWETAPDFLDECYCYCICFEWFEWIPEGSSSRATSDFFSSSNVFKCTYCYYYWCTKDSSLLSLAANVAGLPLCLRPRPPRFLCDPFLPLGYSYARVPTPCDIRYEDLEKECWSIEALLSLKSSLFIDCCEYYSY